VVVQAVRSSAGRHPLRPVDLIEEPDILPEWEEFYDFFERQSALTAILEGGDLELETIDGEWVAAAAVRRGPWSLPWPFYLQIFIGLFMWMVGVASYFHSDRHDGARGFAVSALGMGIVIFPAAVYSSIVGWATPSATPVVIDTIATCDDSTELAGLVSADDATVSFATACAGSDESHLITVDAGTGALMSHLVHGGPGCGGRAWCRLLQTGGGWTCRASGRS
jgi:hypothetical protein